MTYVDGNERAPVVILGWSPVEGEKRPFTSTLNGVVRSALEHYGASSSLVCLSYLLREGDVLPRKSADRFFAELADNGNQVVILLGLRVATSVLRLTAESITDVRRTCFTWPGRTEARFFVTHDPNDLTPDQLLDRATDEFYSDLRAVFQVDRSYFHKAHVIRG